MLLKTFNLSSGGHVAAERILRLPILFQPTRERGRKEGIASVASPTLMDGLASLSLSLCDHFAPAADRMNRHPTVRWRGSRPLYFASRRTACGAVQSWQTTLFVRYLPLASYHAENAIFWDRHASPQPQLFLHHANAVSDYVK